MKEKNELLQQRGNVRGSPTTRPRSRPRGKSTSFRDEYSDLWERKYVQMRDRLLGVRR